MYQVSCQFDRRVNISTAHSINSLLESVTTFKMHNDVDFDVTMKIFDSSSFHKEASDPHFVEAGEPLFISIEEQYDVFTFVVNDCYITSSRNPDAVLYRFFADRCPQHPSYRVLYSDTDVYR